MLVGEDLVGTSEVGAGLLSAPVALGVRVG
jgi:hypothetical protein